MIAYYIFNTKVTIFCLGTFYDDELQDMISESLKMKELHHPNVVNLLGVCLDAGPSPYIVLPYMANGDLLSYLRQHKDKLLVTKDCEETKVLCLYSLWVYCT